MYSTDLNATYLEDKKRLLSFIKVTLLWNVISEKVLSKPFAPQNVYPVITFFKLRLWSTSQMRFRVKEINLVLIAASRPKASDATFSSQVCYFKFLYNFQEFQGEPKLPCKYSKTLTTICYQNRIVLFALRRK